MSGGQCRVFGAIPYGELAIETGSDVSIFESGQKATHLLITGSIHTFERFCGFHSLRKLAADRRG